ncbi:MAG: universal stress protein, partial [Acidobacteriota bacterium]|nr:universal stress protein [Acidobacteriota bacterium]
AKVLNDSDCPVLTPQHSEAVTQRHAEHREIACSIRLDEEGLRILRYASQLTEAAGARLTIVHAIPGAGPNAAVLFDGAWRTRSPEAENAQRQIEELQHTAGTRAGVRIVSGGIKQSIIDSTVALRTDLLVIGRSPEPGIIGRMRDLTYALVRDSLCPVLSF